MNVKFEKHTNTDFDVFVDGKFTGTARRTGMEEWVYHTPDPETEDRHAKTRFGLVPHIEETEALYRNRRAMEGIKPTD